MVVVGQAREKGILAGFNHLGGDGWLKTDSSLTSLHADRYL